MSWQVDGAGVAHWVGGAYRDPVYDTSTIEFDETREYNDYDVFFFFNGVLFLVVWEALKIGFLSRAKEGLKTSSGANRGLFQRFILRFFLRFFLLITGVTALP